MAIGEATSVVAVNEGNSARPFWRQALEPYTRPRLARSLFDLATSVVAYVALTAVSYALLDVSYLLVLALAVPTAGFLLRTYIIFHDCTHGSLMASRRANAWLGVALGLVVFSPFASWRQSHIGHHATAGDLDRRGVGDVPTLTVSEYRALPGHKRLGYRLFRNPLVMFTLGPVWSMLIGPRFFSRKMPAPIRASIIRTNVALAVIVGGLWALVGWQEYLLVQGPPILLAGSAGVFLFYVQHQFEDVYWETSERWSYADAALRGSSHLVLPKVLQFFSGNIGLHHVHHLSAGIPNYNLQRAHDENPIFHDVPKISLRNGIRATRLKLWDEERQQLVTWAEARPRD